MDQARNMNMAVAVLYIQWIYYLCLNTPTYVHQFTVLFIIFKVGMRFRLGFEFIQCLIVCGFGQNIGTSL